MGGAVLMVARRVVTTRVLTRSYASNHPRCETRWIMRSRKHPPGVNIRIFFSLTEKRHWNTRADSPASYREHSRSRENYQTIAVPQGAS
jgi:hypothetical protein